MHLGNCYMPMGDGHWAIGWIFEALEMKFGFEIWVQDPSTLVIVKLNKMQPEKVRTWAGPQQTPIFKGLKETGGSRASAERGREGREKPGRNRSLKNRGRGNWETGCRAAGRVGTKRPKVRIEFSSGKMPAGFDVSVLTAVNLKSTCRSLRTKFMVVRTGAEKKKKQIPFKKLDWREG